MSYFESKYPTELKSITGGNPFQVGEAVGGIYRETGSPRAKQREVQAILAKLRELDPEGAKPPGMAPIQGTEQVPETPSGQTQGSLFQRLDQEGGFSRKQEEPEGEGGGGFGSVASLFTQATKAAQELAGKARSEEEAEAALRQDFEGTPEIDQAIESAKAELATTRSQRQRPGVGEFIAMALMNLAGMNPRMSADMVLGLGEQREQEGLLERRLFGLESTRLEAKGQGRRAYHRMGMERQDAQRRLERELQLQQMKGEQFSTRQGFSEKRLAIDKIMQALGQMRQEASATVDPTRRKKLLQQIQDLERQVPFMQGGGGGAQPKPAGDERQSRMFGLLGGGSFA